MLSLARANRLGFDVDQIKRELLIYVPGFNAADPVLLGKLSLTGSLT